MVFDLSKIISLGEYVEKTEKDQDSKPRTRFLKGGKTFLVVNPNTIELRCDEKLGALLKSKYESVMQSRYFGRGGLEIVLAGGQLARHELEDLIRLSYNMTNEKDDKRNI